MLSWHSLHPANRHREEDTAGLFLPRLVKGTKESSRRFHLLQTSLRQVIHRGSSFSPHPVP